MIRKWARLSSFSKLLNLRSRLIIGLSGIILVIVLGQTVILLTDAIVELDYRVAMQGTIVAQGVATASVALVS